MYINLFAVVRKTKVEFSQSTVNFINQKYDFFALKQH